MAQRLITPVDFSSITYSAGNENSRWYTVGIDDLDLSGGGGLDLTVTSNRATLISNLFDSIGANANNNSSTGSNTPFTGMGITPRDIIIAVRIPQTKRLLNYVFTRDSGSTPGFDGEVLEYTIEASGRSDKLYTELVDWVKVSDNSEQKPDTDTFGFIPNPVKITPGPGDSDSFHSRVFPFMTSWVRFTFKNVVNATDLHLEIIRLFEFIEDTQGGGGTEEAPVPVLVFPKDSTSWLPSQTVMFAQRVTEPDSDACHFGFEIYKESDVTPFSGNYTGPSGATGPHGVFGLRNASQDILMARIESNALNLDGSENQWYKYDWINLPDVRLSVNNQFSFPGYVRSPSQQQPQAVLVVPVEGATDNTTRNTIASFSNIKFYKTQGNTLVYNTVLNTPTLFSANPITMPAYETAKGRFSEEASKTATGWIIEFPSGLDFDRIDFINPASNANVASRVRLYFVPGNPGGGATAALVAGSWAEAGVWRQDPTVAKVEFCYPATTNYTDGYLEGTSGELDADPNLYNPDRVGIGIDQTNAGDWTKVPKFAGLLVGPTFSTGTTASVEIGDSPIPTDESGTATSNVSVVANRLVYARVSLPDPYRDGERFYCRSFVWDGRTEQV